MAPKLRLLAFVTLLNLLFFSLAVSPPLKFLQEITPTPEALPSPKPSPTPLEVPLVSSDGIMLLGLVIFLIIVVPMVMTFRKWHLR